MHEVPTFLSRPNTRLRLTAAAAACVGLGAVSLISGCSRAPGSLPESSDCAAENPSGWGPVPREVDTARVADRLGKAVAKVVNGKLGTANCANGIDAEIVDKGAPVRISGVPAGISDRCLAIMSDVPLTTGGVAHRVGVLCPAL